MLEKITHNCDVKGEEEIGELVDRERGGRGKREGGGTRGRTIKRLLLYRVEWR